MSKSLALFAAGLFFCVGCGGPSTVEIETKQVAALIDEHRETLTPKLDQLANAYSVTTAITQPKWQPFADATVNIPFLWSNASEVDTSNWNTLLLPESHLKYVHDVVRGETPATEDAPQNFALHSYITNRLPKTAVDVAQCLHDGWRDRYFQSADIEIKFAAVEQAEYVLVLRELERTEPELNGTAAFTPGSVACGAFLVRLADGQIVATMPFSSTNDAEIDYATKFDQNQSHDASAQLYANLQEKLEANFHEHAKTFFPNAKLRP